MPPTNGTAIATRPAADDKPDFGKISLAQINDIFATEETTRIPLPDGQWIDVKRELNYGERTEIESASIRGMQREALTESSIEGNTFLLDLGRQRFLMLSLYITRWSFCEPGTTKPILIPGDLGERIAVMKNLGGPVGEVLRIAVEWHHRKLIAAETEEDEVARTQDRRLAPDKEDMEPAPKATPTGVASEQTPSPAYANT